MRIKKNLRDNHPVDDLDDRGPEIEEIDDDSDIGFDGNRISRPSVCETPTIPLSTREKGDTIQTPSGSHTTKKAVGDQIRTHMRQASNDLKEFKEQKIKRKTMQQILKE